MLFLNKFLYIKSVYVKPNLYQYVF